MIFYDTDDFSFGGDTVGGSFEIGGGLVNGATKKDAPVDPLQTEIDSLTALTEKLLSADHGAGSLNDWQQTVQSGGMTAREFYNETGRISALTGHEQPKGADGLTHGLYSRSDTMGDAEWKDTFHGEHSPKPGTATVPVVNALKPVPKKSASTPYIVGEAGIRTMGHIDSPYGHAMLLKPGKVDAGIDAAKKALLKAPATDANNLAKQLFA